jgi:hypothetical protein
MKKKLIIAIYCVVAICLILGTIDINIRGFSHPTTNPTGQDLDTAIIIMIDIFCVWAVISLIGIYRTKEDIKKLLEEISKKLS